MEALFGSSSCYTSNDISSLSELMPQGGGGATGAKEAAAAAAAPPPPRAPQPSQQQEARTAAMRTTGTKRRAEAAAAGDAAAASPGQEEGLREREDSYTGTTLDASLHPHSKGGGRWRGGGGNTSGSGSGSPTNSWEQQQQQQQQQQQRSAAAAGVAGEEEGEVGDVGAAAGGRRALHGSRAPQQHGGPGDDGGAEEAGEGEGEGEEEEEEERPPQTMTTGNAILNMDDHLHNIEYKIRELTAMGVQRLDQIKAHLVEEMERFIKELHAVRGEQHSRWTQLAGATLHEQQRLDTAKALMNNLGMDATSISSMGGQ